MRYLQERRARIEIIPMIDIMLFLLVFFVMLLLKMIPATGHVTKLPNSTTAEAVPVPKLLVEIADDGTLHVEHALVTPAQLTDRLRALGPKTAVTIVGDRGVALQKVMGVLDAVKTAGVTQIAIAAHRAQ